MERNIAVNDFGIDNTIGISIHGLSFKKMWQNKRLNSCYFRLGCGGSGFYSDIDLWEENIEGNEVKGADVRAGKHLIV
jgi:hypothetical protein